MGFLLSLPTGVVWLSFFQHASHLLKVLKVLKVLKSGLQYVLFCADAAKSLMGHMEAKFTLLPRSPGL